MKPARGDVVVGPDFIGGHQKRPFVVVSDEKHPFHEEECIVIAVTTTKRDEAVALPEDSFSSGGLPRESYASPWVVTTLKNSVLEGKSGELRQEKVEEILEELERYTN